MRVGETLATFHQSVEVWCEDSRVAIFLQGVEPLIIGEDDDEIGFWLSLNRAIAFDTAK